MILLSIIQIDEPVFLLLYNNTKSLGDIIYMPSSLTVGLFAF